tara:strand:+ start:19103 stop:20479 length:1377 start_codon:yes stop_codon:yes gene_type:complete
MATGGERYLNWSDFNVACIERGMPPEIFATLRRSYRTYVEGGTDFTTLRWFFNRYASWSRVIKVGNDKSIDDEPTGKKKTPPMILYPSTLLEKGFICEIKPDILWCYGDRGQGKSVASYGLAERWLAEAKEWNLSKEFGAPRIYVYGDVNGYVPSEPHWFRCPDWYVVDRNDADFPLLEVYDEVPIHLRSGAVSKASKEWAEKLTRSRHLNVWTIMNMVQAKMASKRGREMDTLTLDRFSGLRQLRERLEDMPVKAFRDIYRSIVPEMRRKDPGLAMTQLGEDQGDAGTWLTLYETKPPTWLEWRESLKRKKELGKTAAPYPPECILHRARHYAKPIIDSIYKELDDEEKMEEYRTMLGKKPETENVEIIEDRLVRQIMRGAGMQWAAIGEALYGVKGAKKEKMGGGGSLQRWGHRHKFEITNELIKSAAQNLSFDLPERNKSPVIYGMGVGVIDLES